jgi:cytochrome c-type biogenesis protein CcmH
MTLWVILMIITSTPAVLLCALLLPRLDQRRVTPTAGEIEACLDQLGELERNTAAGRTDAVQAEAARAEIRSRLLAADGGATSASALLSPGGRILVAAPVVAILVLGFVGLYVLHRNPDLSPAPGPSTQQQGSSPVDQLAAVLPQGAETQWSGSSQPRLASVDEMIERLVDRLNARPSDPEGWRMLGWAYLNTSRFAQSATAYARAIELNPENADYRSARGEALVRAADGKVTAEARAEFERTLQIEATDSRARFFIGLAKEEAGDKVAALNDWVEILNDTDSTEAWYSDLTQRVTELGRETGIDVSARLVRPKVPATGAVPGAVQQLPPPRAPDTGGPSAEDVRSAQAPAPSDRTAMIRGMVDRLADRLDQSPRDVDGWIRLIRSRKVLGDDEVAEQTLRRALDIFKDAPEQQDKISAAGRELGLSR